MMHIEKGKYFVLTRLYTNKGVDREAKSLEECIRTTHRKYDVPEGQCAKEVVSFLEMAIRHDIVKIDE